MIPWMRKNQGINTHDRVSYAYMDENNKRAMTPTCLKSIGMTFLALKSEPNSRL